jgi:hypothetical protein
MSISAGAGRTRSASRPRIVSTSRRRTSSGYAGTELDPDSKPGRAIGTGRVEQFVVPVDRMTEDVRDAGPNLLGETATGAPQDLHRGGDGDQARPRHGPAPAGPGGHDAQPQRHDEDDENRQGHWKVSGVERQRVDGVHAISTPLMSDQSPGRGPDCSP